MTYVTSQNPGTNYSNSQNPPSPYSNNQNPAPPVPRVAQAKKQIKKPTLQQIRTNNVFLHVYFKKLAAEYTDKDFYKYIKGTPNSFNLDKFEQLGIQIELINNPVTFISDFEKSLSTPGAVVIYFGHTVLGKKKTLGLNPAISKQPKISSNKLGKLLDKSRAKVVLLAGCATDDCVRKVKGDTVVIVTQSGKDRLTNTLQWAPSINAFLDNFVNLKSIGDSLKAANAVFKSASSTDSFAKINGDPTLKAF